MNFPHPPESAEDLMQLAEGTPSLTRFLERVRATGFRAVPVALDDRIADFTVYYEPEETFRVFRYDPTRLTLMSLFHEQQHLAAYRKAQRLGMPWRTVFCHGTTNLFETDAYLANVWLCQRYAIPPDIAAEYHQALDEHMQPLRIQLEASQEVRELARKVLGYDMQEMIEQVAGPSSTPPASSETAD